jgi:hypothetical protein
MGERLVIQLHLYFLFDNCISLCLPQVLFSQLLKDNIEVGAEFINCCCYLFIQIHTPIDLYRERLGNYLDSVGVSLSVGIRVWVAHGAFRFSFSMADFKLLKEVKSLPKLSLACSPLEYFEWEESLDDFFYGRRLPKLYYAEETLANDVFYWWVDYDKEFPCRTWSDMKVVLQRLFLSPFYSRKMVAEAYGSKPQTTQPVGSSFKKLKKLPKVAVPEPPVIHGSVDLSSTSGLHSSASACDPQCEHKVDDTDDVSDGLSMMASEIHSNGTVATMKGQHSNIFQLECTIKDKVCKLIIDGGSFANVISSDVVHALSLSTRRLPTPRYMQWMNQSGTLKITHKARVKFSVGSYIDTVDCDIAPVSACHLLLGRPWQFDLDATHSGRSNTYSFVHKGVQHVLKPMLESAIKAEIFAPSRVKKRFAEITPKPRTALFQEGESDVINPVSITTATLRWSTRTVEHARGSTGVVARPRCITPRRCGRAAEWKSETGVFCIFLSRPTNSGVRRVGHPNPALPILI